jgi:hypothetical protein
MADYTVSIKLDSENKEIVMEVLDAAGNSVPEWGWVFLQLGLEPEAITSSPGHTVGKAIELRETKGADPITSEPVYAMVMRSPAYDTALTDDIDFEGGGGGGVGMYRVKSVQADYLTCRSWDGTDDGITDVLIAKPMKLRNPATETIDALGVSYTYTDTQTRLAASSGFDSEKHKVRPAYAVNDVIYAAKCATDVTLAADHLDLNVDARKWQAIPQVPIP